jgi:multidrug efflux pump subunit AcrB
MSVVFAMMTSYFLSRTLVPTMVHYLLESEVWMYGGEEEPGVAHDHRDRNHHVPFVRSLIWGVVACGVAIAVTLAGGLVFRHLPAHAHKVAAGWVPDFLLNLSANFRKDPTHEALTLACVLGIIVLAFAMLHQVAQNNLIWRTHQSFNHGFDRFRRFYGGFLALALQYKFVTLLITLGFIGSSLLLAPHVGKDFFPAVDAGQIRLHVRVPAGTRLEETETYFARVEEYLRTVIPPSEVATMMDNIGIPNSGINLSLSDGSQIASSDGEVMVALKENHHPTNEYIYRLRKELPERFPGCMFYFAASDIATQVLNFGLPAPIDVQVRGPTAVAEHNLQIAEELRRKITAVPGAADVHIQQVYNAPELRVNVDRAMADQLGLTQANVANSLLISLSSSGQISPSFWLDPKMGVQYQVAVMTPQYKVDNTFALNDVPIATSGDTTAPQLLGNLLQTKEVERDRTPANVTHDNMQPTFDVQCNVQGADLGSVASAIDKIADEVRNEKGPDGKPRLMAGSKIVIRGQIESMNSSFTGLAEGIIGAVILVYLLMAVNFQSWLDPLIILMALPAAVGGILWMLYTTHTTISVPSLMGAMMCIGVATANSILMITFANDQRKLGLDARDAALAAGMTRLRPVIMTALAMIIGMLPMSLGLGEGGEQNAPLGRAVIGGLSAATFATLFFVPVVYSVLRRKSIERHIEPELREPDELAAIQAPVAAAQ